MPLAAPAAAVRLHELAGLPDAQRRGVGGQLVRPPAGLARARPVPLPLLVGHAHAALRGGRPNRSANSRRYSSLPNVAPWYLSAARSRATLSNTSGGLSSTSAARRRLQSHSHPSTRHS